MLPIDPNTNSTIGVAFGGQVRAKGELVVAIDPARFGLDQTALAVRRGDVLLELVAWGQCDLSESVERIRSVLDRLGVKPGSPQAPGSPREMVRRSRVPTKSIQKVPS